MNSVDSSILSCLHTYEAYRVPKGTKVQNAAGEEMVLSNEADVFVLTEKSGKQLVKDRREHNGMLLQQVEMAAQKTQQASMEKLAKDNAKVMAVYRAMVKGDCVPASDERKLQEYNKDLYQAAKMAQAMAKQKERKKHDSQWDKREEAEYKEKMDSLCDESNEAVMQVGRGSQEFSNIQKEHIVEIDSSNVEFSTMKVMSLGAGVMGAYIDLSI